MIRSVVFDFDGTLVKSNHIKRETFFELASEFVDGIGLMKDVMHEADGRERYWVFDRFAAAVHGQADAKLLADRYTQLCQERIGSAPEIPGAKACLERLRAEGKLLFVNSATPLEPLTRLVQLRLMDELFEGIYGAPAKKQENLKNIISKHNLVPVEILVVGDGESDRVSAATFGCHFVAVEGSENDFTTNITYRISDLTRLPEIVSNMGFIGDGT